jgi:predicted transcriptional regulator
MRRSRLELYIDIICAIAPRALATEEIAFQCNTNCLTLQQRLDFLVTHGVVAIEVNRDNQTVYVLTRRGISIFKTFCIAKNLERLQGDPQTKEARQVISELDPQEDSSGSWQNQNR